MTVAIAYRAKQPATLAAYTSNRTAEIEAFNAKAETFREGLGGKELCGFSLYDGGWVITGYNLGSRREEPLAGWRRDGASNRAVPAKRTPEGKDIAAKLKDLVLPGDRYPGSPTSFRAGGYEAWPRVEAIGGEFFLTLSREPSAGAKELDHDIWEPVKLSEYHAAREAHLEDSEALEGSR